MNPSGHTIQSLIDLNAENIPENKYVVYPETGSSYTWKEFHQRVKSVACYLSGKELSREFPVAGLLGNGQTALELFLGGMYGGFQILLANPLSGRDILAYVIEHSETKILFVSPKYQELAEQALSQISNKPEIIFIHKDHQPIWNDNFTNHVIFNRLTNPKEKALLIYTSGTTGRPKGVIHTHESLLYGGWNTEVAHELKPDDNSLCVLPLCHINAQVVSVMGTLVTGSGLVMPQRFQASKFWSLVVENKCTWFSAVPTILSYLMNIEEEEEQKIKSKLGRVRFGRSASAALPPALHKAFEELFGIKIVETMGITETASPLLSNPINPELHKLGSPGKAYGNEVRIADADGKVAALDSESEIQVRGLNLMKGYHKNPEATLEAFTTDGWYRTGDLGKMDSDGYVFVTGRLKELIIKGGENISPREIDDILYKHKKVMEAAAFPLPDENYGQTVAAAIALRPGEIVHEFELRKLCLEALGEYRSPTIYFFLKELPKGPSGKIQRLKLTDLYSNDLES